MGKNWAAGVSVMTFKNASACEQVVWGMKLADQPRSLNRAIINDAANGAPPYTLEQQRVNKIVINSSDLGLTLLSHDARQQFYGAFTKPGNFFTARTDMGTRHRRQEFGVIVTGEVNRIMKKSLPYFECLRSKFALDVLHGIGPSTWETRSDWCGDPRGIEDVLLPSGTRLTMKNVPFVAIFCSWTPRELERLTRGPIIDPGWQMENVEAAIKWSEEQTVKLQAINTFSGIWSPERNAERRKENSGMYASDIVQTIDCWDFYYWNDEDGEAGWSRKIIMDAEGGYQGWFDLHRGMPSKNLIGQGDQFLYDGGNRKYASTLSEIIHFQFADLSAVAPFRYHSVRGLGFMLNEICALQNRMRCQFSEAVFETLMPLMRIDTSDDAQRALSVNLINRGFVDSTVHFLSAAERWQVNHALAEAGLQMNQSLIDKNSSAFVQNQSYGQDRTEKTKFQVMAEVNAQTTLINAALQQAYFYQTQEYYETFRRFMLPDSNDVEVKQFRARCLKKGVPEKMLISEAWELEPERVMGSGNKAMEMAIAQQLMAWLPNFGAESQETVKRAAVLAISDDAAFTNLIVPEITPHVTDSEQAAMSAIGTLMQGGKVEFGPSLNRIEIVGILIVEMKIILERAKQLGPMTSVQEILGIENIAMLIQELIQALSKDKTLAEKINKYEIELAPMLKDIQTLAETMARNQQATSGGTQPDPKDAAKAQAILTQADMKAKIADRASDQRTRQREEQWAAKQAQGQVSHDVRLKQDAEQHALDLQKKIAELHAELEAEKLKLGHDLHIGNLNAANEIAMTPPTPPATEGI